MVSVRCYDYIWTLADIGGHWRTLADIGRRGVLPIRASERQASPSQLSISRRGTIYRCVYSSLSLSLYIYIYIFLCRQVAEKTRFALPGGHSDHSISFGSSQRGYYYYHYYQYYYQYYCYYYYYYYYYQGLVKGRFSNDNMIMTHELLNPPLLSPPL